MQLKHYFPQMSSHQLLSVWPTFKLETHCRKHVTPFKRVKLGPRNLFCCAYWLVMVAMLDYCQDHFIVSTQWSYLILMGPLQYVPIPLGDAKVVVFVDYNLTCFLPWRLLWCSTPGWGCNGWGLWLCLLPSLEHSTWCCSGLESCDSDRFLQRCIVLPPSRPALSPVVDSVNSAVMDVCSKWL